MDEEELICLEGPVIKLGGELVLLIALAPDCSGPEGSSGLSECLKLSIPQSVAGVLRIEVGDMICLRSSDGRFRLQTVKARLVH